VTRTRLKFCGMTRADDVRLAVDLGADAVGFVCWPASPRSVTVDQAARLGALVPPGVWRIGVFVNQPADDVRRMVEAAGLDVVQLHGDEPVADWADAPHPVWKSIGVGATFDAEVIRAWPPGVLPLLDAHDRERRGGTGQAIDLERAAAAARVRAIVLAGGLKPGTVEAAIRAVRPFAVDVSSGVEQAPGIKDAARMTAFAAAVARADGRSTGS